MELKDQKNVRSRGSLCALPSYFLRTSFVHPSYVHLHMLSTWVFPTVGFRLQEWIAGLMIIAGAATLPVHHY
jgi:hypothetical protein